MAEVTDTRWWGAYEGHDADEVLKVLIIEDNDLVAEMYRERLAADGYSVTVANDGQAGLDSAREDTPDLIYVDLRMPRLGGFQVLGALRETPRLANIPVIVLSNYGDPELRRLGLQLGAFEFLVKVDTTPSTLAVRTREFFQTNGASRNGNRPKAPADS